MLTDCIPLYTRMMTKHSTSGTKKSASRLSESSVSAKKTISGSMAQVLAVHALRFIMTVEKNTDAVNQAVQ